jgi:serine/threonine protein kinase
MGRRECHGRQTGLVRWCVRVEFFVERVCDAVQHAHDSGVIHRDLEPANIPVDEAGQPKVRDFGVARAAGADLHTTSGGTEVGQVIGTLAYMSPEQVEGNPAALDTRSDVYALGGSIGLRPDRCARRSPRRMALA